MDTIIKKSIKIDTQSVVGAGYIIYGVVHVGHTINQASLCNATRGFDCDAILITSC